MNSELQNRHTPPERRFRKKRARRIARSVLQSGPILTLLSWIGIAYLKLVYKTNRFVVEPEDILEQVKPRQPLIVAVWHGQHILLPVLPIGLNASAMISKNLDGEITARIVEHFGNRTIRASGGRNQRTVLQKGGITGFLDMIRALETGDNVVQTADVPRGIPRTVGQGIISLAAKTGAPIVPLAIGSSRRFIFKRAWDKAALNLPFGTTAICVGKLVDVPRNASEIRIEQARTELQDALNQATSRAYELSGNPE